jgi:hypothetical protein
VRTLAILMTCGITFAASAQPSQHMGMHMGGPVLFLGRASADQVVPRQRSAATATAAIIVERVAGRLRYDVTFHGLERGSASRVGLYAFGVGGNGPTVLLLCGGGDAAACPQGPSARLAGVTGALRLTGPTLSDFASGRIYIQVDGGDGRPEIRGQLGANGAMVPSHTYLAQLRPSGEAGATGEGTAVLSETDLPGDRVEVEYSVTVAGTSGQPQDIALVGVASPEESGNARFLSTGRLPNLRRLFGAAARGGGSFSGSYVARRGDASAVLAEALLTTHRSPALSVRTSRFPRGELVGLFVPVE